MANTKIPVELSSTPGIVDNSNATAITIDSSENVGIGTGSPDGKVHIESSSSGATAAVGGDELILESSTTTGLSILSGTANDGNILFGDSGNSAIGYVQYKHADNALNFGVNGGTKATIDSSGNVLINGTSKFNGYPSGFVTQSIASGSGDLCPILELAGNRNAGAGNQNAMIQFYNKTSTAAEVSRISSIQGSATNSGELQFHIASGGTLAEAMRIDSSGNLLVSKTAANTSTVGIEARENGLLVATRDGGQPLLIDRLTDDGNLVLFRKDSSTVGSIGATAGVLTIGNNNSGGIIFGYSGSHTFIEPSNTSGASVDDGATLGSSSKRFRDLYLSGGAYIGGTGAANKLDDYEEGTWTVSLTPSASGSITINSGINTMHYTKVGRLVTITGRVNISSISSPTGGVRFNLPFTTSNTGQASSNYATFLIVTHGIDTTNTTQYVMAEVGNNTTQAEWREVIDNDQWPIFPATNLQGDGNEWFYIKGSFTTTQ